MADAGAGLAEAGDFVFVEMDAVGQPGAVGQPADAVEVIHGAQAEALEAEVFLVEGFRQMGVQAHVQALGHGGAGAHDLRSDREGRAGRQGDLDLRAGAALMVATDQPLAVGQDHFGFLHRLLRRQAAIGLAQAHRATCQHRAHAQIAHGLDLHVDGFFQPFGEQVVMIGRGGAAGQQQFRQGDLARQLELLRCQARPDRIERLQPGKQRLVDHRPPGAGERLVEVVMGVDQPRQHHVLAGVEGAVHRCGG